MSETASLSLSNLLDILEPTCFFRGQVTKFDNIADHSGSVGAGTLFFSIPSIKQGPGGYIDLALHKGATAIVTLPDIALSKHAIFSHITFFGVKDIRLALTKTTHFLYPQSPVFKAAITGTNGKTSIAHYAYQLWSLLGKKAASLGTLGTQGLSKSSKSLTGLTTLEPLTLYPLLQDMYQEGITHLALEASSHGLDQRRLDSLCFDVGVFSSFSRDHLDYHGNMRAYWLAKTRLFKDLMRYEGLAILNQNLLHPYELAEVCKRRNLDVWIYGSQEPCQAFIQSITPHTDGQTLKVNFFGHVHQFKVPLLGRFQAENLIAAMLLVHSSGFSMEKIIGKLAEIKPVPGRMEYIGETPQGGHVYVDYAHTPHSLEQILTDLRPHTTKRLGVVFGCGGDRDVGKRSLMGAMAAEKSDFVIITDDNPRYEDPQAIRQEVLKGAPKAREIPDRGEAITQGIQSLEKGDILVITGKGHETIQIVAGRHLPFSDKQWALKTIKQLKNS